MAELKTLTLNGVVYDSFPGRPYFVTVTQETVDESDYQNNTYSTEETVDNLSAAIAAGMCPVARVIYIGPSGGHFEEYFMPSIAWNDATDGRYELDQFFGKNSTLRFTKNAAGGFNVTEEFSAEAKDGVSATHEWDGTVLKVTSASGTSSADLKGEPGKTPIRGVDYWTDADKQEIVGQVTPYAVTEEMIQQVMAALATPVFGRVDEYNNIIIAGNLVPGNYTLKYENADGTVTTIGGVTVSPDAETSVTIPLNLQSGKIDSATGEFVTDTNNNYLYSDIIPIETGKTYTLVGTDVCMGAKICYYDASGNFMSTTAEEVLKCGDTAILASGTAVIPLVDGAAAFRVRVYCYYYNGGYAPSVALAKANMALTASGDSSDSSYTNE